VAGSLELGALALAGSAGGVAWRVARRSERAVAEFPPEGDFVTVDGMRVHAVVRGTGPDLVLIHGSSGNLRDFTFGLVGRLAARYRVIAFDRPGHGHSEPLPRQAEGLRGQARHLQAAAALLGAARPLVLGQSYGGGVALAWAVHHPGSIAGLISVAGVSHPWEGGLPPYYRVTSNLLGAYLAVPLIAGLVPASRVEREVAAVFEPQKPKPGYAAHFGPALALRPDAMRLNARQRARLKAEVGELAPHYPDLRLPIEIVHGDADRIVEVSLHGARLAAEVADARLTVLPGVGHMPHQVAPDEVCAAIDRAAERAGLPLPRGVT